MALSPGAPSVPGAVGAVTTYLLALLLLDTIWLAASSTWAVDKRTRLVATVQLGFKTLVFIIESQGKDKILLEKYRSLPPEVKAGTLGRTFFWWLI